MSIRTVLLSGLALMSTAFIGCGESQPPTAGDAPAPAGPNLPSAPDWLPPALSSKPSDKLIVFNLEHLSKSELEAALGRVVDRLDFESADPAKADFQRGVIAGVWSRLFDEIGYRPFILLDHGVNTLALAGSFEPAAELSRDTFAGWVRTDEPGGAERALSGLRMIDPTGDITGLQPAGGPWSKVVWSFGEASAGEDDHTAPAEAAPTPRDVRETARRLSPQATLYLLTPGTWLEFPEYGPAVNDALPPEAREEFSRYAEALTNAAHHAMAVRWSPDLHLEWVVRFNDEAAAAELVSLREQIASRPPQETTEPTAVEEALLDLMFRHPARRDGPYVTLTLGPDDFDAYLARLGPDALMMPPLAAAAFLGRE